MVGKKPIGERWNFDKENRRPPKSGIKTPKVRWFESDEITQSAIADVKQLLSRGYGEIEPFRWGVTGVQASQVAGFVDVRLEGVAPYQDAMVTGEDTMWHGLLSAYSNLGLLQHQAVLKTIFTAYETKGLPLNSVEGFVRQVLVWREYL